MTTTIAIKSMSALLFAGVAFGGFAGTASAAGGSSAVVSLGKLGRVEIADSPEDPTEARVNIRWEKIAVP